MVEIYLSVDVLEYSFSMGKFGSCSQLLSAKYKCIR